MKKYLRQISGAWKEIGIAIIFLVASLWTYTTALGYANRMAENVVTDIFLDHLPHWNVIPYLAYGTVLFYAFIAYVLLKKPSNIPFVVESVALFILTRSFFMILTHLAPQHSAYLSINSGWMGNMLQGADLFFSGHTGLPFLFALIYWERASLRNIFLFLSISAAISVLLARLHYSIDVFAAYFIVYGIYQIAVRIFQRSFLKFTA